ncbi:hypothetical protein Tco_1209555 [Tanacetum coccineum]
MSQEKEAQKKFYKTREDKEIEKVTTLENKVKVLDDIVYKTGQSVQTMNMLNRNCKISFVKPEFLKKAQRANPRLYDIGCYNDNLALMLASEFDKTIHLAQESRSKLTYPFSLNTAYSTSNVDTAYPGTIFRDPPYLFDYLTRRLTMEEILAKFIDEGRHEHEEMEIFIKEFRTTNELLLKTQSNLLSELKIEVNELSKVVSNVLIPKNEVKGVTTREGKMTFEATHSEEIKEARIDKNKPPRFEHNVQEKPHDDGVENKSSSIPERTTQPSVKPQQSSIPFPNRVRKEKEEALQRNFLENLKQLDINIPFIEALVQIPKYAKYLKSLLTNKSKLKKACT